MPHLVSSFRAVPPVARLGALAAALAMSIGWSGQASAQQPARDSTRSRLEIRVALGAMRQGVSRDGAVPLAPGVGGHAEVAVRLADFGPRWGREHWVRLRGALAGHEYARANAFALPVTGSTVVTTAALEWEQPLLAPSRRFRPHLFAGPALYRSRTNARFTLVGNTIGLDGVSASWREREAALGGSVGVGGWYRLGGGFAVGGEAALLVAGTRVQSTTTRQFLVTLRHR